MTSDTEYGRSPDGAGSRPSDGAQEVSTVPASIPNALKGYVPIPVNPDLLFCDLAEEGAAAGLLALMTGISEEYWCAGWMTGLEYSLWDRVETGPSRYGQGFVTQQQCDLLRLLSQEAGGWWFWYEDKGPRFVRSAEWAEVIARLRVEFAAQGIEAQRAATVEQGVVHESPVAESDAPDTGVSGLSHTGGDHE